MAKKRFNYLIAKCYSLEISLVYEIVAFFENFIYITISYVVLITKTDCFSHTKSIQILSLVCIFLDPVPILTLSFPLKCQVGHLISINMGPMAII